MPSDGLTNAYPDSLAMPEVALNETSNVMPKIFYTCPVGRKAKFEGIVQCPFIGSGGSSANLNIPSDTGIYAIWVDTGSVASGGVLSKLPVGFGIRVEFSMIAGEVVKVEAPAGTVFNVTGNIRESNG